MPIGREISVHQSFKARIIIIQAFVSNYEGAGHASCKKLVRTQVWITSRLPYFYEIWHICVRQHIYPAYCHPSLPRGLPLVIYHMEHPLAVFCGPSSHGQIRPRQNFDRGGRIVLCGNADGERANENPRRGHSTRKFPDGERQPSSRAIRERSWEQTRCT